MRKALSVVSAVGATMGSAQAGLAQATYEVRVSPSMVTPAVAEVELTISAVFDPADHAFHFAGLSTK